MKGPGPGSIRLPADTLAARPLSARCAESAATLTGSSLSLEEGLYPRGRCIGRHAHSTPTLMYIVTGVHWSGYSGGGDICLPGTFRFIAAGEEHENYFPVESRCLEIELGPRMMDATDAFGGVICSPGQLSSPGACDLGTRLLCEFNRNDPDSLLSIEAIALRLLLGEGDESRRNQPIPSWLLQVRERLHEELTTRCTLLDLASSIGRHPVQISRQFHRYFRCTLSEYLRRARIARAQSLLARGDLPLSDIALACGFFDQSHFTTTFTRIAGIPPHRYRRSRRSDSREDAPRRRAQ